MFAYGEIGRHVAVLGYVPMMRLLIVKGARIAEKSCEAVAISALVYLLGVVALNVLARVFFDLSDARLNFLVHGAIEQAAYALLITVFAALPSSIRTGLVSVDILTRKLPQKAQIFAARLWFFVLLILAVVLAVLFGEEAVTAFGRGDTTQDIHAPLYVFYAALTLACCALALVSLCAALVPEPAEWEAI